MQALNIIPQLFFDLIARVVPGFVALYLFTTFDPDSWRRLNVIVAKLTPSGGPSAWFLIVAAYIVGHILSPATKSVQRLFERIPNKLKKPDSTKYDWLRANKPEAGAHCAKLRAEFTLYNSLSAIFFLFTIRAAFGHGLPAIILLFVLGVLMGLRGRETQDTMRGCVDRFYSASQSTGNA